MTLTCKSCCSPAGEGAGTLRRRPRHPGSSTPSTPGARSRRCSSLHNSGSVRSPGRWGGLAGTVRCTCAHLGVRNASNSHLQILGNPLAMKLEPLTPRGKSAWVRGLKGLGFQLGITEPWVGAMAQGWGTRLCCPRKNTLDSLSLDGRAVTSITQLPIHLQNKGTAPGARQDVLGTSS